MEHVTLHLIVWLLRRSVCVCVCALSNLTNYNSAVLPSMMILNLAAFPSPSHTSAAKQIYAAELRIIIVQVCCQIKNRHTSGMTILNSSNKQKKYTNQTETQTERILSHLIV